MKTDKPSNQATAQITVPLDIPGVRVLEVEVNDRGDFLISVESTVEGTKCRQGGRVLTQFHGLDEPITLRHLPILGRNVYLRLRPKRYRCLTYEGRPTTTQQLEWYTPKSPNTQAYERHLLLQMVNATVEDVSIKEELGYKEIEAVLDRWIGRGVDWDEVKKVRTLGLDEIAASMGTGILWCW